MRGRRSPKFPEIGEVLEPAGRLVGGIGLGRADPSVPYAFPPEAESLPAGRRSPRGALPMTGKQFFDWQTSGGTDDVMRLVDCLERADVPWCCIGGVAVNHWAEQQMVTRDVNLVIALDAVERVVRMLEEAGFTSERFDWSVNLKARSAVSIQLSTEDFYHEFPGRSVPAGRKGDAAISFVFALAAVRQARRA